MALHPLLGSTISNLADSLRNCGGIPPADLPRVAGIAAGVALRTPFSVAERVVYSHRMQRVPVPSPLIIVGHFRSGTTYLYNLLSKGDFSFGDTVSVGLPSDSLVLGRLARPLIARLLPKDRVVHSLPVRIDSPQEDETAMACMNRLSWFHGVFFPRQFRKGIRRGIFHEGASPGDKARWEYDLRTLQAKIGLLDRANKRRLMKNPGHTARVSELRRIFPRAQFIHIVRNPYEVLPSMRRFYRNLLAAFALQPWDDVPIDDVILETYAEMMTRFIQDTREIDNHCMCEVRYESLKKDPIAVLKGIHEQLAIPGFETARPSYEEYVTEQAAYRSAPYLSNRQDEMAVTMHWGHLAKYWGYRVPTAAQAPPPEP